MTPNTQIAVHLSAASWSFLSCAQMWLKLQRQPAASRVLECTMLLLQVVTDVYLQHEGYRTKARRD